jgi:hypothetical protein
MTKTRESSILEIGHEIIDTLNGDTWLTTTELCSTFDYVPEGTAEPYIQIDNPNERPWDCFNDEYGQVVTYILHIWSVYRGRKECADIIKRIKELLDNQPLSISGYTHIKSEVNYSNIIRDTDMIHYHGILQLTVNVVQTP